jgi:hypothetical protein
MGIATNDGYPFEKPFWGWFDVPLAIAHPLLVEQMTANSLSVGHPCDRWVPTSLPKKSSS